MNQLGCGTEKGVLDDCVTGTARDRSQSAELVFHINASRTYSEWEYMHTKYPRLRRVLEHSDVVCRCVSFAHGKKGRE